MITLSLNSGKSILSAFGKDILCSCFVRNEINKARQSWEIVYSEPAPGYPYEPREFPSGTWNVGRPIAIPESEPYEYPFFIPTNAGQNLPIWTTVQRDRLEYLAPTNNTTWDTGYGIHFSTSPTTLGCLRISDMGDLRWLVEQINATLDNSDTVQLVVA